MDWLNEILSSIPGWLWWTGLGVAAILVILYRFLGAWSMRRVKVRAQFSKFLSPALVHELSSSRIAAARPMETDHGRHPIMDEERQIVPSRVRVKKSQGPPSEATGELSPPAASLGWLEHRLPDKMRVKVRTPVHAVVALDEAALKARPPGGIGRSERTVIEIAEAIEVQLRAPGHAFEVASDAGNGMYILGQMPDQRAEWSWTITPLRRGTFNLSFVVRRFAVTSEGETAYVELQPVEKIVSVRVNYKARITAGAVAVAIFVAGGVGSEFIGDVWDYVTAPEPIEGPPAPGPSEPDKTN